MEEDDLIGKNFVIMKRIEAHRRLHFTGYCVLVRMLSVASDRIPNGNQLEKKQNKTVDREKRKLVEANLKKKKKEEVL